MCIGEGRSRKNRTLVDDAEVFVLERAARHHAFEDVGRDAAHIVIAGEYAECRLVVAAGPEDFVIVIGLQALLRIEYERREVSGVRRGRCMCDTLALEVRELLVGAFFFDQRNEVIAVGTLLGALGGKRTAPARFTAKPVGPVEKPATCSRLERMASISAAFDCTG